MPVSTVRIPGTFFHEQVFYSKEIASRSKLHNLPAFDKFEILVLFDLEVKLKPQFPDLAES